jgi:integrase
MNVFSTNIGELDMKHTQTFSIIIWAYKTQAQQASMTCTLYARVTTNGKRAEISLKREIDESQWDKVAGKVKGRTPDARDLNNYINEVKRELLNIYQQLSVRNEFIFAQTIKNKFTGDATEEHTLLKAVAFHNENLRNRIGIDIAKGTWVKFNTLETKLKGYIQHDLKKADLYLRQLDYAFVTGFEYYLRVVERIGANTGMKYIRMMKKIMNDAVRKNWLDRNPFQAFRCTFRWPEKEGITWEELDRILQKNFAMQRLQVVKDYFVFSCFTGLAYIDVINLKFSSIANGIDGSPWLVFNRHKTGVRVRVPLLDHAVNYREVLKSFFDSNEQYIPKHF